MANQSDETDVISMAYEKARAESAQSARYLRVIAPAKVNLYLQVGAKQENGYHPVQNVMHTLLAHDVLFMRCVPRDVYEREVGTREADALNASEHAPRTASAPNTATNETDTSSLHIHLTCSGAGGVTPPHISAEQNIAYKALRLLAETLGHTENEVMDVHLEKHLPHQAGLGGGSSDAAAALVGAAQLWGISPDDTRIEHVAHHLGADVAFFLRGGCALFDGVGEHFVRSLHACNSPVVLIMPEAGLSTAQVYATFDEQPCTPSQEQKTALEHAKNASDVVLFNALAPAAFSLHHELAEIHEWAASQAGVTHVMLTGSGSCTYVVCETSRDALRIAAAAQARGWWCACTYFANTRAACT